MPARDHKLRRVRMFALLAVVTACPGIPAFPGGPRAPGAPDLLDLERARLLMGTVLTIHVPDAGPSAAAAVDAAFERVARLEDAMTTWRPDGELYRVNQRLADPRQAGRPVAVGRDLGRALRVALRWSRRTGGLFDPALGTLLDAWAVERPARPGPPPDLETARRLAGSRDIRVRQRGDGGFEIRVPRAGVRFDLGGIGKGWALDEAARILSREGIDSALLDFGGQVLVLGGDRARTAWPVAIADPRDRARAALALPLAGGSLATSSNAVRHRVEEKTLLGHVLDPRSGRPTTGTASYTVLAETATAADALSTALAAGGTAATRLVERAGAAWLVLTSDPDCGIRWLASPRLARLAGLSGRRATSGNNGGCLDGSAPDTTPGPLPGQGADR